tara:strand:+ start:386 stop:901 length:516 start_codon:yes stop_codon:yes gene_type:complete
MNSPLIYLARNPMSKPHSWSSVLGDYTFYASSGSVSPSLPSSVSGRDPSLRLEKAAPLFDGTYVSRLFDAVMSSSFEDIVASRDSDPSTENTVLMDLWILCRSDVVVSEFGQSFSSSEITYAGFMGIPSIGVLNTSFINPWDSYHTRYSCRPYDLPRIIDLLHSKEDSASS